MKALRIRPATALFTAAFLLVLASCNPAKDKQVNQQKLRFKTTDDAELFFKNVRQLYYEVQDMDAAGMRIYRKKDRYTGNEHPTLNLAIVHSWRNDEAYVILEPNEAMQHADTLVFQWQATDSTMGTLRYAQAGREVQQQLATSLYDHIVQNATITFNGSEGPVPFPHNYAEAETFRVTMFDYLRLIGMF